MGATGPLEFRDHASHVDHIIACVVVQRNESGAEARGEPSHTVVALAILIRTDCCFVAIGGEVSLMPDSGRAATRQIVVEGIGTQSKNYVRVTHVRGFLCVLSSPPSRCASRIWHGVLRDATSAHARDRWLPGCRSLPPPSRHRRWRHILVLPDLSILPTQQNITVI